MKVRFPRKVTVAGKLITIKYDRKKMASEFDEVLKRITLGVKKNTAEEKLNSFLHEIIEAIHGIRKTCYERPYLESAPDVSDYLYIMTHDELNIFVSDLVPVVLKLIALNQKKG